MAPQGSRTVSRGRILGTVAALALSLPVLMPTGAEADHSRNVGAGVIHGTTYFDGAGIPPATPPTPCVSVSYTLDATVAGGAAMNTVITGYAGPLHIWGSGATTCTSTTLSGGTLELEVTGTGPTGSQIDCGRAPFAKLTGGYTRVGTEVVVDVSGTCVVNQFGIARVRFVANLAFVPTDGTGIQDHIKEANFDGPFVVVPLQ